MILLDDITKFFARSSSSGTSQRLKMNQFRVLVALSRYTLAFNVNEIPENQAIDINKFDP